MTEKLQLGACPCYTQKDIRKGVRVTRPGQQDMDWHTIVTTFTTVFLAELGDKTNLSTMMLAAQKKSVWGVFAGASLALCLTSLIGALVGGLLYRIVAPGTLRTVAGTAFILMGIMVLLGKV